MADQIFERMDKNNDGRVSIDEFIKVFLEAEDILKQKIENHKKMIDENQKSMIEATNKLNEAKRTERKNQYGI